MKYILALTLIASVAAGSLRATKDDNASVKQPTVEMNDSLTTTNSRQLQMGMETTMGGETSAMMEQKEAEDVQGKAGLFDRIRQKATVTRSNTPATEEGESEGEDTEDIDTRIVGGDVSDANEFPYYGTLPPSSSWTIDLLIRRGFSSFLHWLTIFLSFLASQLVGMRCYSSGTRYCSWSGALWRFCRTNGHYWQRPTCGHRATKTPQLQQQYYAE